MAGGVRCRLRRCYRAAVPLRKPHVKRTSTDTARISRAKSGKKKFQNQPQRSSESARDPATFLAEMVWPSDRRSPSWCPATQKAMNATM